MLKLNTQRSEKPSYSSDGLLDVHSVWETIQGEGPFAGRPAVFVRLAGCNLRCPGCDTDYTSKREWILPIDLLACVVKIRKAYIQWNPLYGSSPRRTLVVITGGEPFRQNLTPFVDQLVRADYEVQIETNGTLCDSAFYTGLTLGIGAYKRVFTVCSPKAQVHHELWKHIKAVKYVVQDPLVSEVDGLPLATLKNKFTVGRPPSSFEGPVYVQPLDEDDAERNELNLRAAVRSCLKFGYTLCIQTHKLAGMP